MEQAEVEPKQQAANGELKRDAITFTDGLVIALASTAPAY